MCQKKLSWKAGNKDYFELNLNCLMYLYEISHAHKSLIACIVFKIFQVNNLAETNINVKHLKILKFHICVFMVLFS